MILVVMQPTYLPWAGYFDLIDQSDLFMLYDDVQFEKQSWQQRNRIKTPLGKQWLTVPVYQSSAQRITDVRIVQTNTSSDWRRKHWKSLVMNYQKAPFWSSYGSLLEEAYREEWRQLAELNIHLIRRICEWLGLFPKFVRASELSYPASINKADRLIAFCKMFEADVYLSPAGSRSYLESDEPFQKNKISLVFQHYEHPEYPQLYGEFTSHLSVLDLLMNTGPQALDIIRSGRRTWKEAWDVPLHDSHASYEVNEAKTDVE